MMNYSIYCICETIRFYSSSRPQSLYSIFIPLCRLW